MSSWRMNRGQSDKATGFGLAGRIRREERYRGEVVRGRDKAAELSSRKGKERNAREDRGREGGRRFKLNAVETKNDRVMTARRAFSGGSGIFEARWRGREDRVITHRPIAVLRAAIMARGRRAITRFSSIFHGGMGTGRDIFRLSVYDAARVNLLRSG